MRDLSEESTFISYNTGLILSIILSVAAYLLLKLQLGGDSWITFGILAFAFMQAIIQLLLFLHLSIESRPRWKLFALLSILLIIFVVIVGSVWIMHNMNYNMTMSSEEMDMYMMEEGGQKH